MTVLFRPPQTVNFTLPSELRLHAGTLPAPTTARVASLPAPEPTVSSQVPVSLQVKPRVRKTKKPGASALYIPGKHKLTQEDITALYLKIERGRGRDLASTTKRVATQRAAEERK